MNPVTRTALVAAALCAALSIPLARAGGSAPSALPPAKHTLLHDIETDRREAFAKPHAPKDLAVLTGTVPFPEPAWFTGIIDSGQAPLPSSFTIINQWHEVIAGEHVNVYAGGFRDDPDAGVVVVDVTPPDGTAARTDGGAYETPAARGAVRIIEAIGTRLILLSARGDRFAFDVTARAYVS